MKKILTIAFTLLLTLLCTASAFAADPDYAGAAEAITKAIYSRTTSVDISSYGIPSGKIYDLIVETAYSDHPDACWFRNLDSYSTSNGVVKSIDLAYDYRVDGEALARYETSMEKALACVSPDMDTLQKVLALHEYFCEHCFYDYDLVFCEGFDVLTDGIGVCRGYTKAYNDALHRLGIEARYIRSNEMSHAWSLVRIDGSWYHVDLTWDDTASEYCGYTSHRYFLLSDQALQSGKNGTASAHRGYSTYSLIQSCSMSATDTRYDEGAFWEGITSPIVFDSNGNALYIESSGNGFSLMKRNWESGKAAVVHSERAFWRDIDGDQLSKAWSGLSICRGYAYFNTPNKILRTNLATGKTQTIYTSYGDRQLYGLSIDCTEEDDYLSLELANEPGQRSGRCIRLTTLRKILSLPC